MRAGIGLGTTVRVFRQLSNFLYRRRHGDPDGLEDFAANTLALASDRKALAVFFDFNPLKRFEILFDIGPLEPVAGRLQTPLKFLAQHKGQKTAKHMAPDGAVALMKDRPGFKQALEVRREVRRDAHKIITFIF